MVSEFQPALPRNPITAAPGLGVAVSAPAPAASSVPTQPTVNVQAPKPIDIKVDTEKLQANLKAAIDQFNKIMTDGGRALNFSVDEQLGAPVVIVKNAETGEVVRKIPNEVVIRIAHNIEAFKGLLHNELT
jgi:flagellar protein FlaG